MVVKYFAWFVIVLFNFWTCLLKSLVFCIANKFSYNWCSYYKNFDLNTFSLKIGRPPFHACTFCNIGLAWINNKIKNECQKMSQNVTKTSYYFHVVVNMQFSTYSALMSVMVSTLDKILCTHFWQRKRRRKAWTTHFTHDFYLYVKFDKGYILFYIYFLAHHHHVLCMRDTHNYLGNFWQNLD